MHKKKKDFAEPESVSFLQPSFAHSHLFIFFQIDLVTGGGWLEISATLKPKYRLWISIIGKTSNKTRFHLQVTGSSSWHVTQTLQNPSVVSLIQLNWSRKAAVPSFCRDFVGTKLETVAGITG